MKFSLAIIMIAFCSAAFAQHTLMITDSTSLNLRITNEYINQQWFQYVEFDAGTTRKKVEIKSKGIIEIGRYYEDSVLSDFESKKCIVTAKQADGKGFPELILSFSNYLTNAQGSYSSQEEETRVWNLDTGEEMFAAITKHEESSGGRYNDTLNGNEITGNQSDRCLWSYDLDIAGRNKMIISNMKQEAIVERFGSDNEVVKSWKPDGCGPDHEEGEYVIENNVFVKKEK